MVRARFLLAGTQMTKYLNDWAETQKDGLIEDFRIKPEVLDGVDILVASYTYEDYTGDAYVLFRQGGKLFEVHGGHCSCYGLEDQWEPEEADRDAILHRINNAKWGEEAKISDAIREALA